MEGLSKHLNTTRFILLCIADNDDDDDNVKIAQQGWAHTAKIILWCNADNDVDDDWWWWFQDWTAGLSKHWKHYSHLISGSWYISKTLKIRMTTAIIKNIQCWRQRWWRWWYEDDQPGIQRCRRLEGSWGPWRHRQETDWGATRWGLHMYSIKKSAILLAAPSPC